MPLRCNRLSEAVSAGGVRFCVMLRCRRELRAFIDPAWEHLKPIGQIVDQRVHRRIDDVQDHPSRPYRWYSPQSAQRRLGQRDKAMVSISRSMLLAAGLLALPIASITAQSAPAPQNEKANTTQADTGKSTAPSSSSTDDSKTAVPKSTSSLPAGRESTGLPSEKQPR